MSAPGIFRPPTPVNEPVRSYAPGSPEREELRVRLAQMEGERLSIPMVIGGKKVETKETTQAVMPHRKAHVLADVAKGGPEHVQQAIDAARAARPQKRKFKLTHYLANNPLDTIFLLCHLCSGFVLCD